VWIVRLAAFAVAEFTIIIVVVSVAFVRDGEGWLTQCARLRRLLDVRDVLACSAVAAEVASMEEFNQIVLGMAGDAAWRTHALGLTFRGGTGAAGEDELSSRARGVRAPTDVEGTCFVCLALEGELAIDEVLRCEAVLGRRKRGRGERWVGQSTQQKDTGIAVDRMLCVRRSPEKQSEKD